MTNYTDLIGLAALEEDLLGAALVHGGQDALESTRDYNRRATRTITLDGGAVMTDTGHSAVDRTIRLKIPASDPGLFETLSYMSRTHPLITVSMHDGCYLACPARCWLDGGHIRMEILLTEEISG